LRSGGLSNSVGIALFTPGAHNRVAGRVDISEMVIGGPMIASKSGTIMSRPVHSTVAYSNSPTTLTINGITYNVAYSNIQNGIARRVFFNGVLSEGTVPNACLASGLLQAVIN